MAKATHTGTCQCCGSTQKLPSGVLSNHGYTVDWGYFSGTCQGARALPFELSIDLIKGFIRAHDELRMRLEAQIKEVRASTDSTKVWNSRYVPATWGNRSSSTVWEEREIQPITREDGWVSYKWVFTDEEKAELKINIHNIRVATTGISLEETIKKNNELYAQKLLREVAKVEQYINWQRERIVDWKPTALTAI